MMNVYDFDKTIYKSDSTRDFYFFCLKKQPKISLLLPYQGFWAIWFALKIVKKTAFKERFYKFFKMLPDIDSLICEFWQTHKSGIKRWYLAQKETDDLIISASPEFLLRPICDELGVRLMASKVDKKSGKYDGFNCYGEEKVNRFLEKCNRDEIQKFYSDSLSDTPIALLAKESFIVIGDEIILWNEYNKRNESP